MDKYPLLSKCLIVGIILLFLGTRTALGVNASYTNGQLPQVIQQHIQAIQKDVIGQPCLVGNTLISNNTGNNYHPRMTTNSRGHTIVVYEQEINLSSKIVPVVYSADHGQTWTQAFLFNSIDVLSGSGWLQYPDIVYNAPNDVFFVTMIDPNAENYSNFMAFIPGDVTNAQEASWNVETKHREGYIYAAAACTDNFFLSLDTDDAHELTQTFGLTFYTIPDFKRPLRMWGLYYDGNSLFQSAPCAEIEMDSNAHRIFAVAETGYESGTKITIKSTVNNEALLTNGEHQNDMDKYADIQQWPGEYLGLGSDPDISGDETKVCVVYEQGGTIKCSYSTCAAGTYEPGFSWYVSTIESGANAPAIYMQGNNMYCAYVKEGNLYLKTSEDGGVTWGTAEQKNDVDGTVVGDKGAVDIGKTGIAFTDTRNGNYDIFFSPIINAAPEAPQITGPAKGMTGEVTYYIFTTIDPDGHNVYYLIDWGDDTNSGWIGPYSSGDQKTVSHTWSSKGNYMIKAKVKDGFGSESGWATLTVTMPLSCNKPIPQFLDVLFQRSPNAFPLLRHLVGC